ncbi:MAG: leucine-rich repeat protein [Prevotella sp.]|nr:leucine-rich repeat protein [Prevotella sp.]
MTTLIDSEKNQSVFYNKNITSFDEFQYFTGLESLPKEAFCRCGYLKTINVPETAVTWGKMTFYNCYGSANLVTDVTKLVDIILGKD